MSTVELEDAAASWEPIYVALALTAMQVTGFLVVYEVCHRLEKVGVGVYDKRRMVYPERTPPPLMQRRGCCRGYLAFEWWRVKVADALYRQQSIEEYEAQTKERAEKDPLSNRKKAAKLHEEEEIVRQADQMCFRESPFYDPTTNYDDGDEENLRREENGNVSFQNGGTEDGTHSAPTSHQTRTTGLELYDATTSNEDLESLQQSMNSLEDDLKQKANQIEGIEAQLVTSKKLLQKTSAEIQMVERSLGKRRGKSVDFCCPVDDDVEAAMRLPAPSHDRSVSEGAGTASTEISSLSTPPSPKSLKRTGILRSKQAVDFSPLSDSSHTRSYRADFPVTIVNTKEEPSRKVRFGGNNDADMVRRLLTLGSEPQTTAAFIQSEEGRRLAALRATTSDSTTWDTVLVMTVMRYIKRRILMLRDVNDDEVEASQSASPRTRQQNFYMRKVMRRPLSVEQSELLRCIGLDSFMTLRFLRFGFDVSFWPFVLACAMLIPIFTTGGQNVNGFYSATILNVGKGSPRYWAVVIFGYFQFLYILRRLWIEWELFLPLRFDFLENGDFQQQKYQVQYRRTCIIEYVPRSLKRDDDLFRFFDSIFPGQIKRAEVLLNTEYLRDLIKERQQHIIDYENVYAKKVHRTADYLRNLRAYEKGSRVVKLKPRKPPEPRITVIHKIPRVDTGNAFFEPQNATVRDPRTYDALEWHHRNIQRLNQEIDEEYLRLALVQRRPVPKDKKESRLSKWLGIKYLTGTDIDRLQSSTAFVEFTSLSARQEAVQCNITGASHLLEVQPVPEIRELKWQNAHVSRALITTRKFWANFGVFGGLLAWSYIVLLIRSIDNISDWFNITQPLIQSFLNEYAPALIVEGLVRLVPYGLRAICDLIRMKSSAEVELYTLKWYFCYRLFTFLFVIIGGSITETTHEFVEDPGEFLRSISQNAVEQADFFITYVTVTGSMQIFWRLSQYHNVAVFWYILMVQDEATSQRKLDSVKYMIKKFHLDEFIPLFIFIFLVTGLYCALAPLASIFVAAFFLCAYKVFKYMTLFIYGNDYEGGGFLFYTLSNIMFYMLYMLILLIAGYLSLAGPIATAAVFVLLLPITVAVHLAVHTTFVRPSTTLSLCKARLSDESNDNRSPYERKLQAYLKAKSELTELRENDSEQMSTNSNLRRRLLPRGDSATTQSRDSDDAKGGDTEGCLTDSNDSAGGSSERQRLRSSIERMERRYQENDTLSDCTSSSDGLGARPDFFIYRQPELNRATWEYTPRPYRDTVPREQDFVFW